MRSWLRSTPKPASLWRVCKTVAETIDNLLSVGQGSYSLRRLPVRPLELLRAWDAADEYVLETVAQEGVLSADTRLLICNDSFGALAVALHAYKPVAVSDSYLSQQATRLNLADNGLPPDSVQLLDSLSPLPGCFDVVLIKVPKTLALLEEQLIRLRPSLLPTSQIIVAGMVKTLPPTVWKLLERFVGNTTTGLAKKKARLIFVQPDLTLPAAASPYPIRYTLEGTDYVLANHANVFSRDSLDIGTRFFLQNLPDRPQALDIIDLGCGNGVVGLMAAAKNPAATVHFVDESFMAVASAQENFHHAFASLARARFQVGDGLADFSPESADLILCNPPFHQHNTIGDQLALSLFKQAKKVLRVGGELWVIGNRHLNYPQVLGRLFGRHSVVASNAKFVIVKTVKR